MDLKKKTKGQILKITEKHPNFISDIKQEIHKNRKKIRENSLLLRNLKRESKQKKTVLTPTKDKPDLLSYLKNTTKKYSTNAQKYKSKITIKSLKRVNQKLVEKSESSSIVYAHSIAKENSKESLFTLSASNPSSINSQVRLIRFKPKSVAGQPDAQNSALSVSSVKEKKKRRKGKVTLGVVKELVEHLKKMRTEGNETKIGLDKVKRSYAISPDKRNELKLFERDGAERALMQEVRSKIKLMQ